MDVVVPFRGDPDQLAELCGRLDALQLNPGDSVTVVDNTPGRSPAGGPPGTTAVLRATGRATPAYARNRGADRGGAEWIVFLDADTVPAPDLLDRYFDTPPGPDTALLGGAVHDQAVLPGAGMAVRYAQLQAVSSQEGTYSLGRWGYPKTSNAAVRRTAFQAVGGFREEIRAAEDADLAYRLRAAGWEFERRDGAAVVHMGRQTVRTLLGQRLIHGSGGGWIERHYPGAMPAHRLPGLVLWALGSSARGLLAASRSRDGDAAVRALLGPIDSVAFELGRLIPNRRPPVGGARIRWARWKARASRC